MQGEQRLDDALREQSVIVAAGKEHGLVQHNRGRQDRVHEFSSSRRFRKRFSFCALTFPRWTRFSIRNSDEP